MDSENDYPPVPMYDYKNLPASASSYVKMSVAAPILMLSSILLGATSPLFPSPRLMGADIVCHRDAGAVFPRSSP